MIFLDSDYFIGYFIKEDSHHQNCLKLAEKIEEEIITSYDVIDEVATKLSYNVGKTLSLQFLFYIEKEEMPIIYPQEELFKKTKMIFQNQPKNKSFLD